MDDLQEGSGYIEISCNADCNPECDIYNIYHNGALVYASKHMTITKDRKNSGRYQCAVTNSISDRFVNSTNSVDINIKCKSMYKECVVVNQMGYYSLAQLVAKGI